MKVFIVHAHHEPLSFNGAMTQIANDALKEQGHSVVISDLYAMNFDPVSDRRNFVTVSNDQYLRQHDEEELASVKDGFTMELSVEMEKLFACVL